LEKERELHLALRALIHTGVVKSAHDCSEGGIAVALAESCISQQIARETPRLTGAQIDLTNLTAVSPTGEPAQRTETLAPVGPVIRQDALLFGESQARILISVSGADATKVVAQARILGVPAVRIGTVGASSLAVKTAAGILDCALDELYDLWWNSIVRAMR